MNQKQFSITEALRFARHDFMNQLQLIRMNLELGRVEDAKTVIDAYASRMIELAELNKLGLPKLYEWIQTAPWIYPGLNLEFSCKGEKVDERIDSPAIEILDRLFGELKNRLNPYDELECHVSITAVSGVFTMGITVLGRIENLDFAKISEEQSVLRASVEQLSPEEWKFTVTAI
jgi:stage 0 sporulation protein B (sporulation initiation phosphotransferase)